MDFKTTRLWKNAFDTSRSDATADEQAKFSACYESMRERAASLTAKIASDLPFMTIHNVTHLDALWEMGSIACGDNVDLNPAEAFVFGGAVLLHDAAMCLAAFPGGTAELKQQLEWKDLFARYSSAVPADNVGALQEAESRATEEALRLLHAKHAEKLPSVSWSGPSGQAMFIIENQQIRGFYGPKIGKIAHSHWWNITRVDTELAGMLGALAGVTSCTVDLLKIACILRVADAMHLDQRRAPAFDFALTQPKGISANHWKFQERMAKPFVQGDALVYTAQPAFEVSHADAWWTAFDALQMVDSELRNVDRVLLDHKKLPLAVRRVEGAHSPTDLARTVETVGWTPVDSTVRVTDVPKIVATLGGSKLYGDSVSAPIRELIQNGLDAIIARRRLQSRPSKWGELKVKLEKRDDGYWFCVEDNGVGMSATVLTGPLIDFGNSFWRSSLAIQEFPGLVSAGMKARGRYGIGFFSVFMLGEHVRVISRRFDRDVQSAKVLEFLCGLGSRPNLREARMDEAPLDGGTRVEVKLRVNPTETDGLLYGSFPYKSDAMRLDDIISSIAPGTDVSISIMQDGDVLRSINAGDWLDVDDEVLFSRISGDEQRNFSSVRLGLTEIRDEEGRVYGRARIEPDGWRETGLIMVDGLAATRIGNVSGVLVGIETTVSRNTAIPVVPAPVLAAWASEQALAFQESDISGQEKASVASVVLALGGDCYDLPLVLWRGRWMSSSEFESNLKDIDSIIVHEGEVEYDEDDNVSKSNFTQYLTVLDSVVQTIDTGFALRLNGSWIEAVTKGTGISVRNVVERVIASAWGKKDDNGAFNLSSEEESEVIGDVLGEYIYRFVDVYVR